MLTKRKSHCLIKERDLTERGSSGEYNYIEVGETTIKESECRSKNLSADLLKRGDEQKQQCEVNKERKWGASYCCR